MLLYEVDGKMLTAQEVFRLYGNGSSSEEEQNNTEPLFTTRTKTVITYLSETGSSSDSDDSDLSSLTSSGSDFSSEDSEGFRKAEVNGMQPNKPLKSVLKKPTAVPQRRDSLHSTEELDLTARTSLGPKQLLFHGGSNGGFTPDVSSPATSASPPSILKRTRNIQIMRRRPSGISSSTARSFSRSASPPSISERTHKNESMKMITARGTSRGDSSRRSAAKTNCINNIQDDLEGALQHIKSMFPSPGRTSGVQDIGVQTKPKAVTESNALAIDYSEQTSPATRLTSEQADEYKPDDGSQLRMEYGSPSSVGAVRHICDDTRVVRSFRKWRSQSKSQRSSIQSLSSITHHSLNQPQTETAYLGAADNVQSTTPHPQIPELEDPVNPNRVHHTDAVKEITDRVAALQTNDSNEGSLVSRDRGKFQEDQANTEAYSNREFIGEKEDPQYESDVIMKSVGEKYNSSHKATVGWDANLHEDSFETEPTAKANADDEATGSTEIYKTSPTAAHSVRSRKNRNSRSSRGSSSSDVVNVNPKLSTRTSRRRMEKECRDERRSNISEITTPRKRDKYSENGQEMDAQRTPIQQNELRRGRYKEQPEERKRRGKSKSKDVKEKISQKHKSEMSAKRLERTDAHDLEERRKSEDRQSRKHVVARDKQEGADRSYDGDAQSEGTPQDAAKTVNISNMKLQEESSNIHSAISGEVGQNFDIPPHPESPTGMNELDQEYLSSSLRPPTLDDVDNYNFGNGDLLGLSDDADANDMKQSEIRSTKETDGPSFRTSLALDKADESTRNDRYSATTVSTITRKSWMRNSEQEPPSEISYGKDGRRAAPKKKSRKKIGGLGGLGGSIFRSSISEIGARIWEQEKIEEKQRQEKGLCKGPRRSKRLRLKPQFHDRPVLEIDEYTGLPSYKKDEEGNVVLENRLRRTPPKRNLKRNRKKSRRKRKRRRLQAERDQIDVSNNEDDSSNRKIDHDEVIPAKQYVWAYSEENPEKEHKLRLTEEFLNVDFKVMDPETGLKGGKALEVGKCATGFLEIQPGQRKRPETSAQTEIYVILKAPMKSLKFKMGECTWHLSANDVFIVPKNNTYYLENLHLKSSILLTFILVKSSEDDRRGKKKKGNKRRSRKKQRKRNSESESSRRRDDILTE